MKGKFFFTFLFLATLFCFTSCDKDDPEIPEVPELITTLTYTLVPDNGGEEVILSFLDLDGDGTMEPTVVGGTLSANTTYNGTIQVLNETESPVEDITEEIEEEDEEHQFFFQTDSADLTISYDDQDEDGFPVGLQSVLQTGSASSGSLTITLKHEPEKGEAGVSEGDITNAGGETDIQAVFPIDVE